MSRETPITGSHTVYETGEDTDDTPAVKGLNINGDDYLLDYGSLKGVPVRVNAVPGTFLLQNTVISFYEEGMEE